MTTAEPPLRARAYESRPHAIRVSVFPLFFVHKQSMPLRHDVHELRDLQPGL